MPHDNRAGIGLNRSSVAALVLICGAMVVLTSSRVSHGATEETAQRPPPPVHSPFYGTVVSVHDGDTIKVRDKSGVVHDVRLYGIDSPELTQPFGHTARNFLRVAAFDRSATVRIVEVDRSGRIVGRVTVDQLDLGLALVEAGLAWHYRAFSNDSELAALEKQAREAGRGLWVDSAAVAPWMWRAQKTSKTPETARAGGVQGPFRGNLRSRVYHAPHCRNYRCQNCTAGFKTAEEAEAAGYRAAGDCLRGDP